MPVHLSSSVAQQGITSYRFLFLYELFMSIAIYNFKVGTFLDESRTVKYYPIVATVTPYSYTNLAVLCTKWYIPSLICGEHTGCCTVWHVGFSKVTWSSCCSILMYITVTILMMNDTESKHSYIFYSSCDCYS